MDKKQALKKVNLFATVTDDRLIEITEVMGEYTIPGNYKVMTQGKPNSAFFIIINGTVRVTLREKDNREVTITTLGPGDFFGEMSLISGDPASASIITMDECSFYIIEKSDFETILDKYKDLYFNFANELSRRLSVTNQDLKKRIVELDHINTNLEEMVQEKTRDLESRNREFQDILNTINQAIFTISDEGYIKEEYSRQTESIFETTPIAGMLFTSLLYPLGNNAMEIVWQDFVDRVFQQAYMCHAIIQRDIPVSEFDYEYKDEAGQIRVKNLNLSLEAVFGKDENDVDILKGLMFIIKDVTETYQLKQAIQEKDQELEESASDIIAIISSDQELFSLFLDEAKDALMFLDENLADTSSMEDEEIIQDLYRKVHTVKGNAGSFGLNRLAKIAHELEDIFKDAMDKKLILSPRTMDRIDELVKNLNKSFMQAEDYLKSFAEQKGTAATIKQIHEEDLTVKVSIKSIQQLTQQIESLHVAENLKHPVQSILQKLQSIRSVPAKTMLKRYPRLVKDLAQNLGKEIEFITSGEHIMMDRVAMERIGEPLVHLIRNSIDHGIESPGVRKQKNKPLKGKIALSVYEMNNDLIIQVQDDGVGIDGQKVIQSALEKGMISPKEAEGLSPEQGIRLIFKPGFSTKKDTSAISGRGVGLDAIAAAIKSVHGRIRIKTKIDQGSIIQLVIPKTF